MTEKASNPAEAMRRSVHCNEASSTEDAVASLSDSLLLERIAAKDQQAMTALFERHSRLVYSIALRVLGDSGQAEDVMQEIFFQLWKSPGSLVQGHRSLHAWLAVVARNRAIDALRRRKPSDPVEDVVLTSKTSLASEVECAAMMDKVRVVLQTLPTEQQRSLELAFFEGLTHSEIAERTGDPLGTVKTRIRSALMSIRKAIQT
jgi:RNA polymerase sigma-70 factor (ECF subfamily)